MNMYMIGSGADFEILGEVVGSNACPRSYLNPDLLYTLLAPLLKMFACTRYNSITSLCQIYVSRCFQ